MIKNIDHVTLVVTRLEEAIAFFTLLGFRQEKALVISGKQFSDYMHVSNIEADHVTLVLEKAQPRFEIQLLKYHHPEALQDEKISNLNKIGYNHFCFAVSGLDEEVERLKKEGVVFLNDVMEFNDRRLVFFSGPDGIVLELSEYE